jgi:hypothetical protein
VREGEGSEDDDARDEAEIPFDVHAAWEPAV